ncbi:uncharacterized protein LOC141691438 [Apium graveolens]|uniref:uncharacterized protein LOC141691438 n=1 Tax=Apium graveolens TaxID=4045 RepID=UPI003D79A052
MSLLAWNCRGLEVCKALHFAGWWGIEAQGHSGGLALLWKNEGGCTILDGSKHYIDFEVENNQVRRWRYTGFYGCPERERRRESWDIIQNLAGQSALPWCIIGDFNDMLFADEKKGGRVHPRSLLVGFGDTIASCGLTDLGFKGEKFTWEKSRGNHGWVQERLDRGWANNLWRSMFPMAEVQVLEVATSDHLPLFLNLQRQVFEVKERRFRFENSWVKEKDCREIVKQSWRGNDSQDLMTKIIMCCNRLQEWGERIKNDEGEWKETTEEIQEVIEDYFSKLFTAQTTDGKLSHRERVSRVTASDNEALLAEITPEEVKEAAF